MIYETWAKGSSTVGVIKPVCPSHGEACVMVPGCKSGVMTLHIMHYINIWYVIMNERSVWVQWEKGLHGQLCEVDLKFTYIFQLLVNFIYDLFVHNLYIGFESFNSFISWWNKKNKNYPKKESPKITMRITPMIYTCNTSESSDTHFHLRFVWCAP